MSARRFSTVLSATLVLAVAACVSISACSGVNSALPNGAAQTTSGSRGPGFSSLSKTATSNTWSSGAPAPTHQFTGAAASIGTKIYLVGGENHVTVLNENDVYDTTTNTWSRAKRMPTGRSVLAAAAVNGLVYAIGGATFNGTPLTTVEAYDPISNTWSTKAPLPTAVDSMSATVDNGLIYVVGGFIDSSGQATNLVQTYDPNANTWSSAAPMNQTKVFAFMSAVGTKIVAAAGFTGTNPSVDNEVYDPSSNTWTTAHDAPLARYAGCMEESCEHAECRDRPGIRGGKWRTVLHRRIAPLGSADVLREGSDIPTIR
jgi:hypothetical protein